MTGDVTKLPKWAQQEIERLTRDIAYLRAKLSEGPEDSDTFADSWSDSPRPLGKEPSIDFVFGQNWGQRFQARLQGDRLVVSSSSRIAVIPQASNVIQIRTDE